jgi:peptide/nickel transport system substrate-binding protein
MLVCCLGVAVAAVFLLRDDREEAAVSGPSAIYGLTLNPSGFDPHIHSSSELGIPFFSVYDTLVYRHPQTMDFVPGLAAALPTMSEDGLSWTFTLKQGVTFHDGTPFNAQAVAANLDRITNDEIGSRKARYLLGPYTGYEILDDYTIQINLSEPYAPLMDAFSQVYLGIASPTALQEYTKNTYQWHQVGTGPYKLTEFVPGDHLVLERNEDYAWGPVFYAPPDDGSLARIEFRFYEDPPTRSLALESGAVQVVGDLLPTDVDDLAGNNQVRVYRVHVPGTPQQFFLNTTRAPLDDLNVRQALLYATNRTAIIDTVFHGESPVAYGPLTSVNPFYSAEVVEGLYPYDTEYARSLLSGAGYTDSDGDGVLDRDGEPLLLQMVFAPWNEMDSVAQLIQNQWADLGIELELVQVANFVELSDYASRGEYDVIALYDFGVDASILNQYYLTDGPSNWSHFSDPEVDGWLAEATRQVSPDVRAGLYQSMQQRVMEQAVVLPVREYVDLVGASTQLDGVIFSAQGWWPLLYNFRDSS